MTTSVFKHGKLHVLELIRLAWLSKQHEFPKDAAPMPSDHGEKIIIDDIRDRILIGSMIVSIEKKIKDGVTSFKVVRSHSFALITH